MVPLGVLQALQQSTTFRPLGEINAGRLNDMEMNIIGGMYLTTGLTAVKAAAPTAGDCNGISSCIAGLFGPNNPG